MRGTRRRGGFTLIELVVVMAIVAVLAALAIPASSRVIQSGRASGCVSNLRNLGVALGLYLGEHNQMMPNLQAGRQSTTQNVAVIDNTLNAYAPDPRVFACPADNQGLYASTGTSYFWNSAIDGQSAANLHFMLMPGVTATQQNSEIPILADKGQFHPYTANKINILYADGHASQNLIFSTSQ